MALTRRAFLGRTCTSLGAALLAFERFGLLPALAQAGGEERGVVCLFLFGGNERGDILFSHSDQQNEWQTSAATGSSATGWGGRTADRTAPLNASVVPVVVSVAGTP